MSVEDVCLQVDRVAGGRYATHQIPVDLRTHSLTRRAFAVVTRLLVVELLIAAAAVLEALALHLRGDAVSEIVWMRLVVILGMTVTLFYFVWRARLGYYWAYSRLRLFSMIFPAAAAVTSAIPGLYPPWMIAEQLVFGSVLVLVAVRLSSAHMREAFVSPRRVRSA